jgi:hypothetical protein
MAATVLGYEGNRDARSLVSWGAAAILVDGDLVNGASGMHRPHDEEEFRQLTREGTISALESPIILKQYRNADRPLVVELALTFVDEAGIKDVVPRKGLRGSSHERGFQVYVFADLDAFNAYRSQVATRVVQKLLDLQDETEGAIVELRERLLHAGLTLHAHDGVLNALQAFYEDAFGEDRTFALEMAKARVRDPLEQRQLECVHRALLAAEAALQAAAGAPPDPNGDHAYVLQYREGVADSGGLALRDAAHIVGSANRVDGFAGEETVRRFPFLRSPPSTQLQAISTGSAKLHFVPTIAGEPFSDRVARYLNLTVLQDIIDGKLGEAVEQRATAQVVKALQTVVQPSPQTVVEHRPIDASEYTRIEPETLWDDDGRPQPKGAEYSEPLVLLGYQSGLLQDWGKLEINIFPGTRIRLASDRDRDGNEPMGIDALKQRNDFLFRPTLFTLVRQRLASGRRKYWLQQVRPVAAYLKSAVITAIPSTFVHDAFVYRLDLAIGLRGDGHVLHIRESGGDTVAELEVASLELSGAQKWMRAFQSVCENLEISDFRSSRLGPVFMPSPTALERVLVVLQEADGPLDRDAISQRIREQFRPDVHVDVWTVVRKHTSHFTVDDGEVSLTLRGAQIARAYLAVERRSASARKASRTSEP